MNLKGKRVLVRIDANVPIKRGRAVDGTHGKIARSAVDLEWLRQRGAKIIVLTHIGRPNGKRIGAYSTAPVARRLKELMGGTVKHTRYLFGEPVRKLVDAMENGDVLVLENVRFDPGEEKNSQSLASSLASLADLYVNDAFSVSHRSHASLDAIVKELPSFAGPSLVHEITVLHSVFERPKKPFVLVMGGLKAKDKIAVMKRLFKTADHIVVGGALANAFLKAQKFDIGKSVYDEDGVKMARELLKRGANKFVLPVDVRVAKSLRSRLRSRTVSVNDIRATDHIVDLGPESIKQLNKLLKGAQMIVWNGPFGLCEIKTFCAGTEVVARAIARRTGKATTVVGGGDTLPVVDALDLANRFTLLSSGGGAMLDYLAGKKLPGVEVLKQ
ncbi:MAG: phosphoglycerate kinase [Candidatus Uhrbacteria bacterium]|nr:phosphoglycerate kinase [Patescibacteria group bacterium]MBU1906686.1 phosphoglycerate kinase [Patescibacteria group bacterium]